MKTWLKNYGYLLLGAVFIIIALTRLVTPNPPDKNDIYYIMEDSLRRKQAEVSLQKFNDSIFKNIAFKGIILDMDVARTNSDKDSNFIPLNRIYTRIIGNIYNPKNVPLQITRIYNFRDLDNAQIYKSYGLCLIDGRNIGDSIIKKMGEDFYRIKFNSKKYSEEDLCKEIRYTIDYDYFYTH